jgi:hypothetical protein
LSLFSLMTSLSIVQLGRSICSRCSLCSNCFGTTAFSSSGLNASSVHQRLPTSVILFLQLG